MKISHQEYQTRRQHLFNQMESNSIAIISAAPEYIRTHEGNYPYRQNSDFYYLTGFKEPEAVAVFLKNEGTTKYILFNRPRDLQSEQWTGFRAGQKGAIETYGADESYSIDKIDNKMPELFSNRTILYFPYGRFTNFDLRVNQWIETTRAQARLGINPPNKIVNLEHIISEMRLIKSEQEIATLQKSADINIDAFHQAIQSCKPNMHEYELEAEVSSTYLRNGARGFSFPMIVASGKNACTLHYDANDAQIKNGDLVLLDAGCEYEYYASDITRTFPANGKFTPEQRTIYELALAAQLAGIAHIKPGSHWKAPQIAAVQVITQGLCELGLLEGEIETLIAEQAYRQFYMHNFSHWIGLDAHDFAACKINDQWRTFKPGMIMSAEPGIYISPNLEHIDPKWHGIGVRIEDMVLVTNEGNRVLTEALPKTVEKIENLMNK